MFQTGTSPSSGSYREILTRLVACATSQHVSAVAINAAGTGYTVGNILTIAHAGGYQSCQLEVLTIGGGGAVSTVAIRSNGAFSNRVATVAVNAGGTGYPVSTTVILEIQGGTSTEKAKVAATTNGSGVVTAVSLIETGGAYTVAPAGTGAATAIVGPSTATTGSGCTINTTMTGLIGTTGIAATGGSGSGATFNLTLVATGWTALLNANRYSTNGVNDEKEVVLQGTAGTGTDPIIGFRTYTATSGINTNRGWGLTSMDSFNGSLAYESQPNIGPNAVPTANLGPCFLLFDNAQSYWFSVRGRRIVAVVKAVGASITSYVSMHAGLMSPFGTATESPYPVWLSGSTTVHNRAADAAGFLVTGISELYHELSVQPPGWYRAASNGAWLGVGNSIGGTAYNGGQPVLWPVGGTSSSLGILAEDQIAGDGAFFFDNGGGTPTISIAAGSAASQLLMPTLTSNEVPLYPLTVYVSPGTLTGNLILGELEGVYWLHANKSDGTVMASEDTVTVGGVRYRVFANAHRTERYSFFALEES